MLEERSLLRMFWKWFCGIAWRARRALTLVTGLLVVTSPVLATGWDLTEISIEELMNIQVVMVSRRAETLSKAAAAIFVITQDDIRRSGVTSIAEALRMVPGFHVGRMDASKWAISARGFNGRFANKLLVLVDGRSVYNPLFSGVFWEIQDLVLQDIDRIEVIRGPGATLWGTNAVNGVINIITKSSTETYGGAVSTTLGSEERMLGSFRFGGKLSENLSYRIYMKGTLRDTFRSPVVEPAADDWNSQHGGFRSDWVASDVDHMVVQGNVYRVRAGQTYYAVIRAVSNTLTEQTFDSRTSMIGGNLLGRWSRATGPRSEVQVQAYYTYSILDDELFTEHRHTADVDLQHQFAAGERQEIVWGVGCRVTVDGLGDSTYHLSISPANRTMHLVSGFAQDEVILVPGRLRATIGTKLEYNEFTGWEMQPSVRMAWTPRNRQTVWAAASRAVRRPTRAENDGRTVVGYISQDLLPGNLSNGFIALSVFQGGPDMVSENVATYELGYRVRASEPVSLDVAMFYSAYKNLRSGEAVAPTVVYSPSPAHVEVVSYPLNKIDGTSYGAEVAAEIQARPWWRIRSSWTWYDVTIDDSRTTDPTAKTYDGNAAEQAIYIRSSFDLPKGIECDLTGRFVGAVPKRKIPTCSGGAEPVERYTTVDARVSWRPTNSRVGLSLVGQNLLQSEHAEYEAELLNTLPTLVERGVYGAVTWRF